MADKCNVLLITCDQLRPHALACYGNQLVQSPHIDRLAASGLRYATAITNAPVCMASRSILLSGQHNRTCTGGISNVTFPARAGDYNMPEYPEHGRPHLPQATLAELLQQQGYSTTAIGKWHIYSWPQDLGFEDYLIPRTHHAHTCQQYTRNGGMEFTAPGFSPDFETAEAQAFLAEKQKSEQPWFLYFNLSPPHNPLCDAPEEYLEMYDKRDVKLRPNVNEARPFYRQNESEDYWLNVYRWDFRYYGLRLPFALQRPKDYDLRQLIAEYYGLVTWVDHKLGQLLASLESSGQAENTLVVFLSDHGDCLGSNGLAQKGTAYDESIRIPAIFSGPDIASRVEEGSVFSLVDVAPTILGYLGSSGGLSCEPFQHMQGKDFSAQLLGKNTSGSDIAISELGFRACRSARFTYAELPPQHNKTEQKDASVLFFDNWEDPYQLQPRNPEDYSEAKHFAALLQDFDSSTAHLEGLQDLQTLDL